MAELSEVPTQIDPKFWRRRIPLNQQITKSLDQIEKGYFKYSLGKEKKNTRSRVFRKIFRSLEFYRRSHRQRDDLGEAAVNLSVAFEILLTDNYSRGVGGKIVDRVSVLLKGVKGVRSFRASVEDLYDARSSYVHAGIVDDTVDIDKARAAFVRGEQGGRP